MPQISTRRARFQHGLSLVELMVSLALGLVLIGAMLTLLARNSHLRNEQERSARQVENGRYAMQKLSEDLHHAGYYGDFTDIPAPGAAPDPCVVASSTVTSNAALRAAMAYPVQGLTDASAPPGCIDASDFVADTSVLVTRFVHPTTVVASNWTPPLPALPASQAYLQATVQTTVLGTDGTAAAAFDLRAARTTSNVTAPIYRYMTRIYFLSPCSRYKAGQTSCTSDADDGVPVPSLKMIELRGSEFSAPIPVAEGIERVEYDYGIDSNNDGSPDGFSRCTPSCTALQWSNVVAVRVSLLARNNEPSADYTDTKTYAMGLAGNVTAASAAQRYKRHAYQAVVRVNNASMRREQ